MSDMLGHIYDEAEACRLLYYNQEPYPNPEGHYDIERPKPPCGHYSYSNSSSQGSLITQTNNFPDSYDPGTHDYSVAYSDRIQGWDMGRMTEACELAGGVDQYWAYSLPHLSEEQLLEFARVTLNTPVTPEYVRVVHHYNVATGYSCPTVHAVYERPGDLYEFAFVLKSDCKEYKRNVRAHKQEDAYNIVDRLVDLEEVSWIKHKIIKKK